MKALGKPRRTSLGTSFGTSFGTSRRIAATPRLARCALALGLLLGAAGCGGGPRHSEVTIMVPWSQGEFHAFYSVIEQFEHRTGIHVNVEVTRALTQQLDAAVAGGAPPDLAMLPNPGAIDQYARAHQLRPLDVATGTYVQPFRGLATLNGKAYAVPVKADVKSLIWYDPAAGSGKRLDALQDLAAPEPADWCLGLESGPTSGWPGADWIADILLARQKPAAYAAWVSGELRWTDRQVRDAWTTWLKMLGDGIDQATVRQFGDAAKGMTRQPPTCSFTHGTLAAMSFADTEVAQRDYDFETSTGQPLLEVSADFVGLFTDNPGATALIGYLSGRTAQRDWVNASGGYAISADSEVTPGLYANPVQRRIATMLQPDSGYTLCFSAADAMKPDMAAAFYRAVLDSAAAPATLPELLRGLQNVQAKVGASPVSTDKLCT
ncbi:extracellular solute-binding protein [Streptomyces sp. NBC_01190]|uniref:extracellular solute-binding protein n=1 Tax=Streptomyces sp. NBC_01190 TaxID=2903767 RepID=UPI0038647E1C|nr:extracellular solute-binding protein [Streptomyces sp. NBC_01190]